MLLFFTPKKLTTFGIRCLLTSMLFIGLSFGTKAQVLFNEDFATVVPLPAGWASQNLSNPLGTTTWFQGNNTVFPSQAGAATAYIGANFNSTAGAGTISTWLFTPNVTIKNGDVFTFYTRRTTSAFPDRLQVRLSLAGASTDVGATETSTGDFSTLLLDINPTLTTTGYPSVWTQYTITISGVAAPTSGRLAFRYFVTSGGPSGANSDYIGIDEVVYTAVAACTGTPAPGATNSTINPVCPGINFTLSLATPGSGVTYQWQSSPNGTAWTNISGATNATLTTNQTTNTYYQCIVSCGSNTGTSTPLQVTMASPTACYCIPLATDCTDDDVITRVRIGTLDNSSACSAGPPAGYTYYSAVAAPTLYSGAANPITINHAATWSKADAVWIDYNQNGQFETSEFTAIGTGAGGTAQISGTISIPSTALNGTTRMRVRMKFGTAQFTSAQSCTNASGFGETEDYNVTIAPCVPVSITSSPASVAIVCGQNASFTVATSGTLPAYGWEYRPNATAAWQNVVNGGIYSGATTATLTLTGVSAAYSGYQYRALVTGGCSAIDASGAATLTVNAIQPVVSPASATICLGSVQQLSLTNTVAEPTTVTFNATTGLPLTVPDGDANGILSSPVAVSGIPAGSVIKNVSVKFSMTHPWAGDIVMNLKAPNGQVLNLVGLLDGGTGSNGTDDFVNTVVDSLSTLAMSGAPAPRTNTFRADRFNVGAGALGVAPTTTNFWAPLLGTVNGNWQVAFSDLGATDVGVLSAWSISITYVAPNFAQGVWAGPAGTIFTDAAATTAYTGTPATTVYVKPTATSNYTVNFTTSTPCTSATTTVPVTVNTPVTGLTVSPATRAVCIGGSTTFTASTTAGSPVNYQWQRSTDAGLTWSSITGATSATLTVSNVTLNMTGYRYRVTTTGNACAAVTSTTFGSLTVNNLPAVTIAAPVVNIVPGTNATISATSTPAAAATNSWTWTLNGTALAGNTSTQVATIDGLGTYQATVTDVNGCVNTSNQLVIGAEMSDKLWIYPNPTDGAFQVRLYQNVNSPEKRVVSVYNSAGQLITSQTLNLNYNSSPYQSLTFDLSGMARGVYVVKAAHEYSGRVTSGLLLIH